MRMFNIFFSFATMGLVYYYTQTYSVSFVAIAVAKAMAGAVLFAPSTVLFVFAVDVLNGKKHAWIFYAITTIPIIFVGSLFLDLAKIILPAAVLLGMYEWAKMKNENK